MEKKPLYEYVSQGNMLRKTLLVMRLTVFLVCALVLVGRANVLSQYRLNVNLGETTYKQLFDEIRKQTGCIVMYNDDMLDKNAKVKAIFKDVALEQVLADVLSVKGLTFEKDGEFIMILQERKAAAQIKNTVITGKVHDKQGNPLPGVSVFIQGTTVGVASDIDGKFTLEVPGMDKISLVFSFIGMRTKTIDYKGQKQLDVTLEEDVNEMDEVVVTGYQKIERRKLTSSITTIDMDVLKTVDQPNIDKLLQGQVPGMTIMTTSGAPGAVPQIRIRGTSTLSGNAQPLWVVDGIILDDPVDASAEDLLNNRNLIASGIGGLNVEDIETINVLKDASATAIYGTKAANGVIVITSKKGKTGKTRVNFTSHLSVSMRPRMKDAYMMNSKERIDVNREMIERGVFNATSGKVGDYGTVSDFERYFIDVYDNKLTWSQFDEKVKDLEEVNTDWFKELFRNSVTHKQNLSISGGSEKTTFYVSASYMDDQATAKGVGQQTYTGSMKVYTRLRENLKIGAMLDANVRENKSFFSTDSRENPYEWAIYTTRAHRAYDENGDYNYFYYNGLPFNFMENRKEGWRNSKSFGMRGTLDVEWKIIPDLTFSSLFSFSKQNTTDQAVAKENNYTVRVRRSNVFITDVNYNAIYLWADGGYRKDNSTNNSSITFRNQLAWMPTINENHRFDVMIGQELRTSRYDGEQTVIYGYVHDRGHQQVPQWDLMSYLGVPYWEENMNRSAAVSWFAVAGYTFMNRYTINFNARTDGSNRFGIKTNDLFQPLWSVGINYQLKEENFLRDVKWLDYLALRASYGSQGNVASQAYSDLVANIGKTDEINKEGYLEITAPKNPHLKWEMNYTTNVALEFSVLNRRLSGTLEYYYKKAVDLLANKTVSQVTGFDKIQVNWASMKNSGVELSLNSVNIRTKDFEWTTALNIGYNDNEVLDVYTQPTVNTLTDAQRTDNASAAVIGKPINGLWSFRFAGLNEDGRPTFYTAKEDETVLSGMKDIKGLEYSGTTMPPVQGGLTNTFTYKNFTLSCLLVGSFGNVIRLRNLSEGWAFGFPDPTQNMSKEWVNRFRKGVNENTNIPALENDRWGYDYNITSPYNAKMYDNSTERTVKGDFVRLQNLSLSYELSTDKMRNFGVQSIRFMVQGNNLHVWNNSRLKGQDPEATGSMMKYSATNSTNVSIGNTYLPLPRSYSFSLSVQF